MRVLGSRHLQTVPRRRLGDLVERLTNGFVGPTRDIYVEKGVPYLLARHVRDGQLSFDGLTFVSAAFNEAHKKSKLKRGDVLVVQSGHIGHTALVGVAHEGHNCHAMIVVTPKPEILDGRFLSYYFNSPNVREWIEAIRSGSTVPHLTCTAVRELSVPTPPLAEQHRIAGTLGDALEGVSVAKANVEKNLQNAHLLRTFESERLFTDATSTCLEQPLEEVASIVTGFAFKSADFSVGPGLKCIKITNVGVGEFVPVDGDFLPFDFAGKYGGFAAAKGSIVLALTRTIIGAGLKVAVVPEEFDQSLVNQRVAAITAHREWITADYLFAYLRTRRVRTFVQANVNTLMQPNLSIADLRQLPVPVPTVAAQVRLVDSLATLSEQVDGLVSVYRRKLTALDELKNSLLHQAFNGALTAKFTNQQLEVVA